MAQPRARIAVVQLGFALAILAILARAVQLQLVQGERWAEQARRQRTERAVLPARRGGLYDRTGVPLAISQEFYRVGIAPNELTDARSAGRLLSRSLGISWSELSRDLRAGKRWIYYHGPFTATQLTNVSDKPAHLCCAQRLSECRHAVALAEYVTAGGYRIEERVVGALGHLGLVRVR